MRQRLPTIRLITLLVIWGALAVGCVAPLETLPDTTARLRVTNTSEDNLENATLIFPNERINFGPLLAGATSEYRAAKEGVYGYAAYEVTINGGTIMQPVIDWVGERPLAGSAFNYVLSIDLERPQGAIITAEVRVE